MIDSATSWQTILAAGVVVAISIYTFAFVVYSVLFGSIFLLRKLRNRRVIEIEVYRMLDADTWPDPNIVSTVDFLHIREIVRSLTQKWNLPANTYPIVHGEIVSIEELRALFKSLYARFPATYAANRRGRVGHLFPLRACVSALKIHLGVDHESSLGMERAEAALLGANIDPVGFRDLVHLTDRMVSSALAKPERGFTISDLNNGVAVLWNLDRFTPVQFGSRFDEIERYLESVFDSSAFVLSPRGTERCLTACHAASRLLQNCKKDLKIPDRRLKRLTEMVLNTKTFVLGCWNDTTGGFAYAPGKRANVLHTRLALDYAAALSINLSTEIPGFVEGIRRFLMTCYDKTNGVFPLYPGELPNPHATYNAIKTLEVVLGGENILRSLNSAFLEHLLKFEEVMRPQGELFMGVAHPRNFGVLSGGSARAAA